MENSKWRGMPFYDRPLGKVTEGIDDGREVVTITDFSNCTPSEHISDEADLNRWQVMDYRTDELEGNLLYAANNNPAPDITLQLNVSGWYAVYLWLMGSDSGIPKFHHDYDCTYSMSDGPALKLTNDKRFHYRFRTLTQEDLKAPGIEGCFWRYVDLAGQSLTIRHQGNTVWLAAIQLIPLSPAEVEAVQRDKEDKSLKRLIVKGDHYSPVQIERFAEQLRDTDVGGWIMGWENSGDGMRPEGSKSFRRLRECCSEIGAEAYICDRPGLWSSFQFRDEPRFMWFQQHPEYHCKSSDGTDNCACSYAIPEVQDYMLDRVRSAARVGPDGFGYFFNRDPHSLVMFEEAAIAGFEEKHGVDPLTLSERDDRLVRWRMDIINGYMRRVRQTLDEVAEEKGYKRIKMIHSVLGNEAANYYACLDIPTWVKEGLVDILMPYPFNDYPEWWLGQGYVETDVKYFASLVKETDCKLVPMWLTNMYRGGWVREHVRWNEFFKKAIQDYADGADGLTGWDHTGLHTMFTGDRWLRLGHKDKLEEWAKEDVPVPPFQLLRRLGGGGVRRLPPGSGG